MQNNPCNEDKPCNEILGYSCSKDSFFEFIRENLADCKEPYAWSNNYINKALDIAILLVVNTNKDEFTKSVEVTLENNQCIQSTCKKCEGIIEVIGNVNGICETPKQNKTAQDRYLSKMYKPCSKNTIEEEGYKIESFDILGDGGCQFKVTPPVPKTGIYKLNVLCVQYPNINGSLGKTVCRHQNEILYLTMGIVHMLEDDRDVLTEKADRWFNLYFKIVEIERQKDQDIFIESIKYGKRVKEGDE